MRILVTGAYGFVGKYMVKELQSHGHEVIAWGFKNSEGGISCDLSDATQVHSLCKSQLPEAAIHLAGISTADIRNDESVDALFRTNVLGTYNLCQALKSVGCKVLLFVSSGLVFGGLGECTKLTESDPAAPTQAYGQSKLSAEYMVRLAGNYSVFRTYIARPFNHIGPGQSKNFVVPALAHRIKLAAQGAAIDVGNLSAYRDFLDVRDIVTAYRLIIELQPKDNLFVLASGKLIQIQDIFERLVKISGKDISIKTDQTLVRRNEVSKISGDASLAQRVLGWKPQFQIDESLKAIFEAI